MTEEFAWTYPKGLYRYIVHLFKDDGGWSVIAAKLPGVASQGDTPAEALHNVREALMAALDEYESSDMPVPLQEESELPIGASRCTVFVQRDKCK